MVGTVAIVDTVGTVETTEAVGTVGTIGTVETTETLVTVGTVEMVETQGTVEMVKTAGSRRDGENYTTLRNILQEVWIPLSPFISHGFNNLRSIFTLQIRNC